MSPAPGEKLAHYRLIAQIGEGGMGVVWKAEDTKLNRHVALKILPPHHLEDEERRLRFMREARAAAAVNHPAIAAVYEVGEADGLIYIAMELVEGSTLRDRMGATGGMPLRDVLRFAVEMAEALASAHQAGIVHRDLKPENVMIRPDRHVKILDFGLAKLLEPGGGAADDDEEPVGPDAETRLDHMSAEMTQQGRIFGTAAYMSPEQARGQAVDQRSDVFSLGVVLYEMITGTSPFRAETTTDTLSAIVRDTPRDPAQLNPQATGETGRILTKCLEKDPADRYQHTDELAADLRKLRRDSESQPLTRTSGPQPARRPAPWKRALPWAAAAGVLLALAAVFLLGRLQDGGASAAGDDGPRALAVMPFENLSDAEDRERLGQILQELIITDLSGHEALDVVSSQRLYDIHRQLAGGQPGRSIDRASFTEVAGLADATTLLTGTLSRLGERWIIAGQMADLATGRVLQSERIDGDDLYHMVSDLTRRIRSDLLPIRVADGGRPAPRGAAPPPAPPAVAEQTTTSLDAYQRYLEGLELLAAREYEEAAKQFEQALELDPGFGQATLRLAIARWWMGGAERPQGPVPPKQLVRRLLEGGAKLPPRDRRLAEGMLAVLEERYQDAEDVLMAMTRRHPEDKEAWYLLGEARYHRNPADLRGATDAFTQALELDPSFETAYSHLGKLNLEQRRYDTQIRQLRGLMRSDPGHRLWHEELYHALLARGRDDEADQVLQSSLERFTEDEDRRKLWLSAAEAWLTLDDRRRYLECLQQVVALAPEHPETLIAQGRVPAWDGRWAEAAALYQRALDADPEGDTRVDALQRLTLMAINLGQVDEATRHATGMAFVSGNKSAPTGLLVRAYLSGGRLKQAEEILEDGLSRQEDDNARRAVLAGAAWSYLSAGQADKAEALTRRGLALEGGWETERQLRDNLPEILLHQGRLDEAEQAADRALELMPHSLDPERMLALIALARGDAAGAAARYRRLIEEGPATSWLRAELAVALAEQGKFEAAEREARAAFEASPGRREHEALAWVLVAGELDLARGMELARAAVARPDWWGASAFAAGRYFLPSAEHALGLGLLKSGRGAEAVGVLERAVALQPGRVSAVADLRAARG